MLEKISVIIPTYNGKYKIKNILSSLEKQTFQDFEVIVVIDGSIDGTYDYLKSQEWKLSGLTFLQQENKGRSGARNAGADLAKGDYLIFFDDDVIAHESIIYRYISFFRNGEYTTAVGSVEPNFSNKNCDFQQYCGYLGSKWGKTVSAGELKRPYITANNFGISRIFFHKMGGFDERLNDAEDFDLAVRIFEAGYPIFYDSQLIVHHQLQSSFRDYINRQLEYKNANEQLLAINPVVRKYKSHLHYGRFKRAFLWFFSFSFFPDSIDNYVFKLFPAKVRFKLYDWVLEANILFGSRK